MRGRHGLGLSRSPLLPLRRVPARVLALASVLALAPPAWGQGRGPGSGQTGGPGATHLIVVSGLGGESRYSDLYYALSLRLLEAAEELGVPPSNLVYLAEDPSRDLRRITGRSSREELARAVKRVSEEVPPGDPVLFVLLGHGSQRDGESLLNLPGPDLSGADFARLLESLSGQRLAVVNAASAGGGFISALSGPGRIVMTATASPRETNETIFGQHFVEALTGEEADADKDGRVSLLEAFEYARLEVKRSYEADHRILTEHALLDDDGDGTGSREPDPRSGDGALARRFFLSGGGLATRGQASVDPELAALYDRRGRLQDRIEALRLKKESLDPAAYEGEREELLLELARTVRAIREREKKGAQP